MAIENPGFLSEEEMAILNEDEGDDEALQSIADGDLGEISLGSLEEGEAVEAADTESDVEGGAEPAETAEVVAVTTDVGELTAGNIDAEQDHGTVEVETEEDINPDAPVFAHTYQVEDGAVEGIVAQLGGIKDRVKDLRTQRDEGEIDQSDYDIQFDELNDEKIELVAEKSTIESKIEANSEIQDQLWEHDQKTFFAMKDYKAFHTDDVLYGALNASVVAVAKEEGNENLSGMQILMQAAEKVTARFNLGGKGQAVEELEKQPTVIKKKPKPAQKIPNLVTLGDMPASQAQDTDHKSKYEEIDNAIESGDIAFYEGKLAQMSPQDQDNYLRGH